MKPLVFLHGLEGKPMGHKGGFLASRYSEFIAPALEPDLDLRLEVALETITEPSVIVGSSLGALTALMFTQVKPDLVLGLVLMAPALGALDPSRMPSKVLQKIAALELPEGITCKVLGASQDELVDPQAIRRWVNRAPQPELVQLEFVEDNHGLGKHLEHMNKLIQQLME